MKLTIEELAYLVDTLRQRVVQEEAWITAWHTTPAERAECMARRESALGLIDKLNNVEPDGVQS